MKKMQVRRDGVTAFATFVGVISHWGFSVCLAWNFEASTAGLVRTSLHASKDLRSSSYYHWKCDYYIIIKR